MRRSSASCLAAATLLAVVSTLAACAGGGASPAAAPPRVEPTAAAVAAGEWPAYGNDPGGSRYSPLAQIDRGNVGRLRPAWTFHTGALKPATELNAKAAFESTPVVAGGTLYVTSPFNQVFALDPVTGAERWRFDPGIDRGGSYSEVTSRGVALWRSAEPAGACAARVLFGTLDARLIALDAADGRPCADFGRGGEVDLTAGVEVVDRGDYQVTSAPTVIGDLVVVGSSIGDNGRYDKERGVVRAYDVRTGALRWSWDPLLPGAGKTGAANAWSTISADPEHGLVFVPTGSASPDYFGGLRPGENRHANSVVALRAATGELVWSFQVVHHDLWDYDVAAQPLLVTVPRGGAEVPAVAVNTKMGNLFLLHRETGEPLYGVEERPVPASDVAGEQAAATQPFSANPPLVPQRFAAGELFALTPGDRESCEALLRGARNEGMFTPPSLGGTLVYPGNAGGVAWGGAAWDPERDLMLVNTIRLAFLVRLIPREEMAARRAEAANNRLRGEFGSQRGTPYGMYREPFIAQSGLPCTPPPWGTLVAVDLATGEKRWEVPNGVAELPGGKKIDGLPGFGGPLVTGGGLVFLSAAFRDDRLRAYDVETGKVLWEAALPAGGQATPMTYLGRDGKQYVVIAAGGHGKAGTRQGDSLVAFALP
ncbi:MAG TPA: pyrroloquinoline quinone-dependent dehydrogenase [Thermoanaerobaculia bacterium]|nr:pyrroloquinoline quinone-dependent dehydrogenase [Thermoanaerobaculia bacterium]